MYIPGRLRTASRPLRTWICSLPYSPLLNVASVKDLVQIVAEQIAHDRRRDPFRIETGLEQHVRTGDIPFVRAHAFAARTAQLRQRIPPAGSQLAAYVLVFAARQILVVFGDSRVAKTG